MELDLEKDPTQNTVTIAITTITVIISTPSLSSTILVDSHHDRAWWVLWLLLLLLLLLLVSMRWVLLLLLLLLLLLITLWLLRRSAGWHTERHLHGRCHCRRVRILHHGATTTPVFHLCRRCKRNHTPHPIDVPMGLTDDCTAPGSTGRRGNLGREMGLVLQRGILEVLSS